MNFVQISNWMNENNYLTPRGKVFSQQLAWSIVPTPNYLDTFVETVV